MSAASTRWYWRQQTKGLCGRCGRLKDDPMACECGRCKAARNPRRRQHSQTVREAQRLAPGPNQIACCGDFRGVRQVPAPTLCYVTLCCGRQFRVT